MAAEEFDKGNPEGTVTTDEALLDEFRLLFPRLEGSKSINDIWVHLGRRGTPNPLSALCLSGGGIRSATFCLGVLQGLAREKVLERFHYLSTVSGGCYIGSWLSRWRAEESWAQKDMFELARSSSPATNGPVDPVRRLRSFSNYLSPVWGMSLESLALITIFLRNLLFNLLVWIPLILALAGLTRLLISLAGLMIEGWPCPLPWSDACTSDTYPAWFATAALPILVALGWLLLALLLLVQPWMNEATRERHSRVGAWLLLGALVWLLPFLLFIHVPAFVLHKLDPSAVEIGLTSGGVALATALFGYWNRYGAGLRKQVDALAERIGIRLLDLLAAIAIVAIAFCAALAMHAWAAWQVGDALGAPRPGKFWQWIAQSRDASAWALLHAGDALVVPNSSRFWHFINASRPEHLWILGVLVLGAMLLSLLVGANRYSLHALYGNRLVRAYLGSARRERTPSTNSDIDPNDDMPMADLPARWAEKGSEPILFQVINMTLNLTRTAGHRRDWQERKAASFTVTPLYCGCAHLGYTATADYGGKPGMTLGRAMTISGAAASPSMGYNSSPLVALVMTFFNIRLGWWLPNVGSGKKPTYVDRIGRIVRAARSFFDTLLKRLLPNRVTNAKQLEPSGLGRMLTEGFSGTTDESDWLYLSDGGHFENLGLYEMVRRRCLRIVVVDATCDGSFDHADLHNAVRKIRVDFGIPIDLPPTLPGQPGPGETQRVVIGRICYSAVDKKYRDGVLFCVKPLLNGAEPPSLTHYAATSRRNGNTFPHHSTTDQFFNETQFESYRLLGEFSAKELAPLLGKGVPPAPKSFEHYPLLAPNLPTGSSQGQSSPVHPPIPVAEPPPASLSGWQRITTGMQSIGTGGLMAGTLTTVGAIGLVGTIGVLGTLKVVGEPLGLRPGVVSLAKEDRALLKQGLVVHPDADTAMLLVRLSSTLSDLEKVLRERGPGPGGGDPDHTALINSVNVLSDKIQTLINRPSSSNTTTNTNSADLTRTNELLGTIVTQLRAQENVTDADLARIVTALQTLTSRIDAIGPRRNVRGQ